MRDGEGWLFRCMGDGQKKPLRNNFGFGPFQPAEVVLENGPEK